MPLFPACPGNTENLDPETSPDAYPYASGDHHDEYINGKRKRDVYDGPDDPVESQLAKLCEHQPLLPGCQDRQAESIYDAAAALENHDGPPAFSVGDVDVDLKVCNQGAGWQCIGNVISPESDGFKRDAVHHQNTGASETVRTPPFLHPGPCTDCAPFSKFVGNGAIPTPGTELKKREEAEDIRHIRKLAASHVSDIETVTIVGHAPTTRAITKGFATTTSGVMDGFPFEARLSVKDVSPTIYEETLSMLGHSVTVDVTVLQTSPALVIAETVQLDKTAVFETVETIEPTPTVAPSEVKRAATTTEHVWSPEEVRLHYPTPIISKPGDVAIITGNVFDQSFTAKASLIRTKPSVYVWSLTHNGTTDVSTVTDSPFGLEDDFKARMARERGGPFGLFPDSGPGKQKRSEMLTASQPTSSPSQPTVTATVMQSGSEIGTIEPTVPWDIEFATETVHVIAGSSSGFTLSSTVDSEGNTIYVTKAGDWARSTVTVSFEDDGTRTVTKYTNTAPAAVPSVTTKTVTSISVVTVVTVMEPRLRQCTKKINPFDNTTAVVNYNGSDIPITAATMTYNNDIVFVTPSPFPQATVMQMNGYQNYALELLTMAMQTEDLEAHQTDILNMSPDEIREHYPFTDWAMVAQLASELRSSHSGLRWEMTWKFAMTYLLEHPELSKYSQGEVTALVDTPGSVKFVAESAQLAKRDANGNVTMANIYGDVFPMTRPTQSHGSGIVAIARYPFDFQSAAQQTPIPSPPACLKGPSHNKTKCKQQKCLLKHYAPINITTIFPGAIIQDSYPHEPAYGWLTQETSLTRPHYGVTDPERQYYPTKPTASIGKDGNLTPTVVRNIPSTSAKTGFGVGDTMEKDVKCWDHVSCCNECAKGSGKILGHDPWVFWLGLLGAILGLLLLALCCTCCLKCCRNHRRNRKIDANAPLLYAIPFFGRKKRAHDGVVNPTEGQQVVEIVQAPGATPLNPTVGNGVDPPLAAALPAAGSAIPNGQNGGPGTGTTAPAQIGPQTVGDDGRGTTGRRAEEGRGKVQFADGPGQTVAPGPTTTNTSPAVGPNPTTPNVTGGQQVVTSPSGQVMTAPSQQVMTSAPTTAADHAEPIPVHDGASDGMPTGHQMFDTGSVRGRKRVKQDGAPGDMLNFRF